MKRTVVVNNEEVSVDTRHIALAKIAIALGIVGVVIYLSPGSITTILWAASIPILIFCSLTIAFGIGGQAVMDLYNEPDLIVKTQEYLRNMANGMSEHPRRSRVSTAPAPVYTSSGIDNFDCDGE